MVGLLVIENSELIYRRQFILGSSFVDELENRDKIQVGENLFLTSHSDLEITQVKNELITLTLIGFLINPYKPYNNNKDNLQEISKMERVFSDEALPIFVK